MNNERNIPILEQSTIKQQEVKQELINYSELRRQQDAAYKEESNFTAVLKNLVEQDKNDFLDALQIAQTTLDRVVQDDGIFMDLNCRVQLIEKAARFQKLYNKLNK